MFSAIGCGCSENQPSVSYRSIGMYLNDTHLQIAADVNMLGHGTDTICEHLQTTYIKLGL